MNYTTLAPTDTVTKTVNALKERNFNAFRVQTKTEAIEKIRELIPAGASVMNGSSETLREIGLIDVLKSKDHPWNNLHDAVLAEPDPEKKAKLRNESVLSEYYLGSVHALTEKGEIVIASNTGSQMPHIVYTSPNLVFVVGTHKIVPDLESALVRIEEHVIPLEDERMKKVYGFGTTYAKTLILRRENPNFGRTITVIFVDEVLGY